jgi:hypothetical protein
VVPPASRFFPWPVAIFLGRPAPTAPDLTRIWDSLLVLIVSLYFPCFGTYFGSIYSASVNGLWHGWMYMVLLVTLASVVYLVLKAGIERVPVNLPVDATTMLASAAGFDALLTIIAFVDNPGGSFTSWQVGAFTGLIASLVALGAAVAPWMTKNRSG